VPGELKLTLARRWRRRTAGSVGNPGQKEEAEIAEPGARWERARAEKERRRGDERESEGEERSRRRFQERGRSTRGANSGWRGPSSIVGRRSETGLGERGRRSRGE